MKKSLIILSSILACALYCYAEEPTVTPVSQITNPEVKCDSIHDQYLYVAQKLGIFEPPSSWWRGVCKIIKKYNIPLSLGIGSGIGCFIVSEFIADKIHEKFVSITSGAIGITIVSLLFTILSERFANDEVVYMECLIHFIKEWPLHKRFTPAELYPLFDLLSQEYQQNQSITIDPQLLKAIDLVVAASVIKSPKAIKRCIERAV